MCRWDHLIVRPTTYYALVVETAGTPKEALVSDSSEAIQEILSQINKAIDGEPISLGEGGKPPWQIIVEDSCDEAPSVWEPQEQK
jgi:hypothetical protein